MDEHFSDFYLHLVIFQHPEVVVFNNFPSLILIFWGIEVCNLNILSKKRLTVTWFQLCSLGPVSSWTSVFLGVVIFFLMEVEFTYRKIHLLKVYNSFSVYSQSYAVTTGYITFSSPQKENLYPLTVTALSFFLPAPGKHKSAFLSVNLPVLDISCKWT